MVKKTHSLEGKNPTCFTVSHPYWFLPYVPSPRNSLRGAKEVPGEQSRLSLALRSHDQIPASHWSSPPPHTSMCLMKVRTMRSTVDDLKLRRDPSGVCRESFQRSEFKEIFFQIIQI